jgi:aryl-alcohol dehydrogenase-like predicted oxidoreductase
MPPSPAAIDTTALRAGTNATAKFAERFRDRFADDFFRLTETGLSVSSIGIGTYLGDSTDEDDALYESAIVRAIRSGVNLIDTAINYRSQRSERAIGAAIQQVLAAGDVARDELVVCSKGGYIPLDRTPPATREEYQQYVRREFIDQQIVHPDEIVGGGHSIAPRFLRYCLAKSRQNLGLRTIDIYYVHNPGQLLSSISRADLLTRMRAVFAMLEDAAARNEIGVYGCATWDELSSAPESDQHLSLEELVAIAREVAGDSHRFRAVQTPVSLAMLDAVRTPSQSVGGRATTTVQAAAELGLTVVGSATLMQSRLTAGLPPTLRDLFPAARTDAQRAIEFARTLPGVTASLVGMKTVTHVDENLESAKRPPLLT